SGSIIPLGPELEYITAEENPTLTLKIYPGQDGEFLLYEDEGDSYRYEQYEYSNIAFTWKESNQSLTISRRDGTYSGMPKQRRLRGVLASQPESIQEVEYSGEEITLSFA